jgi:type IX secretion system PorP/SprF family membrane protein
MKTILIIISLVSGVGLFAQQTAQFGNASFNPFLINPAAGGMSNIMQLEVTYRSQWSGYNGGPRTAQFAGNSVIKAGDKTQGLEEFNYHDDRFFSLPNRSAGMIKHVVGGYMYNDAVGPFSKTAIQGSYAIHLPLTKEINIGAGLGLGYSNLRLDESRVVLHDEMDNAYATFLGSSSTFNGLDATGGIVAYSEQFSFGVSSQQILNNKITFNSNETESRLARHYYLHGSYLLPASKYIDLEPNIVGKFTKKSPSSIEAGVRMIYKKRSWLNVQYRTSNALVFRVGSTLVKNLYVAYGYEASLGKLTGVTGSSHEIQLGILLGNNRNIDKEIEDSKKQSDPESKE